MTDPNFDIKILDLHWIKNEDDPSDLCAHGHLYLKIGDQIISEKETGDWTLSSTALSLLRTIDKDHKKDEYSNQLLPCCGHFFIADDKEESVLIQGCDTGIDWEIIHIDVNSIRHIFENGYEVTVDKNLYKIMVLNFADQIELFFKNSKGKTLPTDEYNKKGYLTFWKEWRNLRDKWK